MIAGRSEQCSLVPPCYKCSRHCWSNPRRNLCLLVRLGWSGDNFLIFGQLTDNLLYTSATEDNQILCSYGAAFEIFLGDASGQS